MSVTWTAIKGVALGDDRWSTRQPWNMTAHRKPWTVASDGRILLARRGLHEKASPAVDKDAPTAVAKYINTALANAQKPSAVRTSVAELRRFCGKADRWYGIPTDERKPPQAYFCGLLLNRQLIAFLLRDIKDQPIALCRDDADYEPLAIVGDDWVGLVMPMTEAFKKKTPTFKPKKRAA